MHIAWLQNNKHFRMALNLIMIIRIYFVCFYWDVEFPLKVNIPLNRCASIRHILNSHSFNYTLNGEFSPKYAISICPPLFRQWIKKEITLKEFTVKSITLKRFPSASQHLTQIQMQNKYAKRHFSGFSFKSLFASHRLWQWRLLRNGKECRFSFEFTTFSHFFLTPLSLSILP